MRIKMFVEINTTNKGVEIDADVIGLKDSLHYREELHNGTIEAAKVDVIEYMTVNGVARIVHKAYRELK